MTKEELKQEARQKALEWNGEKINGKYNRPPIANWSCYEKGYLAGAEPREKQIQALGERCLQLQKDKGELTDRVNELEAQIEKMKRYLDCEYCEHYTQPYGCKDCNEELRSDWKLKEIKEKWN